METLVLTWKDSAVVVEAVKKGEVVAFPTETVYGLGAIASSKEAYDKLVAAKQRPEGKPFTLMVASYGDIARFAEVDAAIISLIHGFMPGQVTFLLKARKGIPSHIDLGTGVIGVRFPDCPELAAFIEKVDEPLLVPSANISGEPPCKNLKELQSSFAGKIPFVIDGGETNGKPSTIVDLSEKGKIKLVREGLIPFAILEEHFNSVKPLKIALGCDHGGFLYKEKAKEHLKQMGYEVQDYGTHDASSCDYPIFAKAAADAVSNNIADLGFLVCTSGEGVAIAANKVPGIRCGIGYDDVATAKNREHNHANMIAFGQKYMKEEDVLRRIDIFLTEMPSKLQKHIRRVEELEK